MIWLMGDLTSKPSHFPCQTMSTVGKEIECRHRKGIAITYTVSVGMTPTPPFLIKSTIWSNLQVSEPNGSTCTVITSTSCQASIWLGHDQVHEYHLLFCTCNKLTVSCHSNIGWDIDPCNSNLKRSKALRLLQTHHQ